MDPRRGNTHLCDSFESERPDGGECTLGMTPPGLDTPFSTNMMLIHRSRCLQARLQQGLERLMTATTRKLLWRFGWLAVLGMHFPLAARLIGAMGRGESVSGLSIALVGLSMAVFAAEIVWCPLLRVCSDRRKFVVMLMIIALVHTGMIESPNDLLWISSTLSTFAVVIAVAVGLAAVDVRRIPQTTARFRMHRWLEMLPPVQPFAFRIAHPSTAPPVI